MIAAAGILVEARHRALQIGGQGIAQFPVLVLRQRQGLQGGPHLGAALRGGDDGERQCQRIAVESGCAVPDGGHRGVQAAAAGCGGGLQQQEHVSGLPFAKIESPGDGAGGVGVAAGRVAGEVIGAGGQDALELHVRRLGLVGEAGLDRQQAVRRHGAALLRQHRLQADAQNRLPLAVRLQAERQIKRKRDRMTAAIGVAEDGGTAAVGLAAMEGGVLDAAGQFDLQRAANRRQRLRGKQRAADGDRQVGLADLAAPGQAGDAVEGLVALVVLAVHDHAVAGEHGFADFGGEVVMELVFLAGEPVGVVEAAAQGECEGAFVGGDGVGDA